VGKCAARWGERHVTGARPGVMAPGRRYGMGLTCLTHRARVYRRFAPLRPASRAPSAACPRALGAERNLESGRTTSQELSSIRRAMALGSAAVLRLQPDHSRAGCAAALSDRDQQKSCESSRLLFANQMVDEHSPRVRGYALGRSGGFRGPKSLRPAFMSPHRRASPNGSASATTGSTLRPNTGRQRCLAPSGNTALA
jgi:hypothetical protein